MTETNSRVVVPSFPPDGHIWCPGCLGSGEVNKYVLYTTPEDVITCTICTGTGLVRDPSLR